MERLGIHDYAQKFEYVLISDEDEVSYGLVVKSRL
jgi:hypothetical protein